MGESTEHPAERDNIITAEKFDGMFPLLTLNMLIDRLRRQRFPDIIMLKSYMPGSFYKLDLVSGFPLYLKELILPGISFSSRMDTTPLGVEDIAFQLHEIEVKFIQEMQSQAATVGSNSNIYMGINKGWVINIKSITQVQFSLSMSLAFVGHRVYIANDSENLIAY